MAFDTSVEDRPGEAWITLKGELDAAAAPKFKELVERCALTKPQRLVIFMNELAFLASAGLRVLIFARQKMGSGVGIYVVGCQGPVRNSLEMSGFHQSVFLQETYNPG